MFPDCPGAKEPEPGDRAAHLWLLPGAGGRGRRNEAVRTDNSSVVTVELRGPRRLMCEFISG